MLKKFALLAGTLSVVAVIGGCAFSRPYNDAEHPYNESWSRAKNLSTPWGFGAVKDVEVPQGVNLASDGSFLVNTAGWTANMLGAANSNFLPGTSNFGSALDIGLGISLVSSIFEPTPTVARHAAFGYIPVEKAKTMREARHLFVQQVTEAMQKTAHELYPNAEIRVGYKNYKGNFLIDEFEIGSIWIIDENIGCMDYRKPGRKLERDEICSIGPSTFAFDLEKNRTGIPHYIGKDVPSYRIPTSFIYPQGKLNWPQFLASMNKYMPPLTMVYVTSKKDSDGKFNPPMVIEKGRVNFFVKPHTLTSLMENK